MDAISVKYINRQDTTLVIGLEGIPGENFDYWFVLNGGTVESADVKIECTGGNVTSLAQECFLKCTVSFENKDVELKISLCSSC
jgi:hypothetical protein